MPRKQMPDKNSSQRRSGLEAKSASNVTEFPSSAANYSNSNLEEQIRQRAYDIYEKRGRQDGLSEQDWLQAEVEIAGRNGQRTA